MCSGSSCLSPRRTLRKGHDLETPESKHAGAQTKTEPGALCCVVCRQAARFYILLHVYCITAVGFEPTWTCSILEHMHRSFYSRNAYEIGTTIRIERLGIPGTRHDGRFLDALRRIVCTHTHTGLIVRIKWAIILRNLQSLTPPWWISIYSAEL